MAGPGEDPGAVPPPPPVRPPRPRQVPGYVFEAPTTADAGAWMQHGVFHTHSRLVAAAARPGQPLFLWDGEAQQLHGVFQRDGDAATLQQDLTSCPGPQGYQVHVVPYYRFPVTLSATDVEDVLVELPTAPSTQHASADGRQPNGCSGCGCSGGGSAARFEPLMGSVQHGFLYGLFMKRAKKLQQQQQQQQEHEAQPPQPQASPPGHTHPVQDGAQQQVPVTAAVAH